MAVNTDSIVSNLYSTYSTQSKTGKTNKENVTGTENSKVSKTNGNYVRPSEMRSFLKKEQSIIRN